MKRISKEKINLVHKLRVTGHSIPEIASRTGIAKTTVQRYVLGVEVPEKYRNRLRERQGGSKERASGLRSNTLEKAKREVSQLSKRDRLLLLAGLYWGEGTKSDFAIINSDPLLIQAFICCVYSIGIHKDRLSFALRVHSNISIPNAKMYWSRITGLPKQKLGRIEVIEGKKKGKLPFGMCRIRIRSGVRERLFIQTIISLIGKESAKRVVSA